MKRRHGKITVVVTLMGLPPPDGLSNEGSEER